MSLIFCGVRILQTADIAYQYNGNVGYLQFFTPKSLLLSVHHKVYIVVRKRFTYGENIDSIKSKDWESSPFATQIEDNIEKDEGSKECLRR